MAAEDNDKQDNKPKREGGKGGGPKAGQQQKQPRNPNGAAAEAQADVDEGPQHPAPPARLIETYRQQIVPAMVHKFGYNNQMSVPKLEKIVIATGLGKAAAARE